MKKEFLLTLGLVAFIILAVVFLGFYLKDEEPDIPERESPVACTMEAKICPDGTSVGRTGPNCEFAPCPSAPVSTPQEEEPPQTLEGGAELDMGIGDASVPPSLSPDMACRAQGGTWNAQYRECVGVGPSQCGAIGGRYDECASACRNDPNADVCTMQCVEVCTVE